MQFFDFVVAWVLPILMTLAGLMLIALFVADYRRENPRKKRSEDRQQ